MDYTDKNAETVTLWVDVLSNGILTSEFGMDSTFGPTFSIRRSDGKPLEEAEYRIIGYLCRPNEFTRYRRMDRRNRRAITEVRDWIAAVSRKYLSPDERRRITRTNQPWTI